MIRSALAVLLVLLAAACAREGADGEAPSQGGPRAEAGADGAFLDIRAEAGEGKILLALPAPGEDGVMARVIHASGITAGLGSNPVGFDRGAVESGRILAFRRAGNKIVIEQENWRYRASADNALEKQSVRDSFARSFLWAGEIAEEGSGGGAVVDISGFLATDTMNLRGRLKAAGQGDYKIAAERSFPDAASLLVFPDNVEIDAFLTFAADEAGREVAATAAEGRAFTLTIHHSFVRLPDDGFETRDFDTRMAAIDVPYYDYSAPLDEPIVRAFARRFRLERVDPAAPSGPVKKPIVFYVDSGAPAPVREALIEGAMWWADAFEDAGFEDAFRVEVLPEGAHPMDVRYNVIQWAHRQTRGWSYGGGVYDPRTGEMLKAAVILGSQRVRQDRMIFEGLAGTAKTGTGQADDPVEIALARIRQLSAHEVGHPLGFAHNFAASMNDRASVMDYPAPYVRVRNGALDFSEAYSSGIGDWDKATVKWLYSQFPEGADEKADLENIVRETYASGLRFIDDRQGRSVATGNPHGSVWDNGDDPVAVLNETMEVRRIALENFGLRSLRDGQPTGDLKAVIVPVYLYHRYQVDAAAKLVGGYAFRYAQKGDGASRGAPVPPARQRAALDALVATLDPAALDLPDSVLDQLTPSLSSFGGGGAGELFASDAAPMFDLSRAADAAAAQTLGALFHPQRIARLIETARRDENALTYEDALAAVEARLFAEPQAPRRGELARTAQTRFVSTLIEVAGEAPPAVAARTDAYLRALRSRLGPGPFSFGRSADQAHRAYLAARIDTHLAAPAPARLPAAKSAEVPPGSPIGAETCWFCDVEL